MGQNSAAGRFSALLNLTEFELNDVFRTNLGGQEPAKGREELRVKIEPVVRLLEVGVHPRKR
jgi:hypothetical protein